jgi:hypothetical protein
VNLVRGCTKGRFIAADDAYPLIGSLLKPYPFSKSKRFTEWADSWNYHLSNLRCIIETAFGVFIQRWGVFWDCLRVSPKRATEIICCCVKLHNFIIDTDGNRRSRRILRTGKEYKKKRHYQHSLQFVLQSGHLVQR